MLAINLLLNVYVMARGIVGEPAGLWCISESSRRNPHALAELLFIFASSR